MNKQQREVTKSDLMSLEEYSKKRKVIRKEIVNYKKNRRIPLGPYANFYFESYETMKAQIQEMLYIEKGGDEQLKDELAAYNPLVPNGKELVATLMFEIDNPLIRTEFLNKIGGIENKIFFKVGNQKIQSIPENDVDRTSAEGKASSVQFVHFKFTDDQIASFKNLENEVLIGIDHNVYNHTVTLSSEVKKNLLEDFN